MRHLPTLLVLVLASAGRLCAQVTNVDPITTTGTISDKSSVVPSIGTPAIDLRNFFAVPTITDQVLQFTVATSRSGNGTPLTKQFNIVVNSTVAPKTVANFLAYVNAAKFSNSLIHRSVPTSAGFGYGIIQGGGYLPNTNGTTFTSYFDIATTAPVALEAADTLANTAGTIAMARTSAPNSATSGWFINTVDNSSQFLPASTQAGNSYAAFGRVAGTGMNVVNSLAALPVLYGKVPVTSSSTTSKSLTVDSSRLPGSFGPGWSLLGSTVTSLLGNFVTLSGNANATITTTTSVDTSLFGSPFDQLPVLSTLPVGQTSSVELKNLVTVTSIKVVPVFPSAPGGASMVTFSAVSSNPNLVSATISGSMLQVGAAANLSGSATVTVTATDSNGNRKSLAPFTVTIAPQVVNDFDGNRKADIIWENTRFGSHTIWLMNGSTQTGSVDLGVIPTNWRIATSGDFNGDGQTDIIWEDTNSGARIIWLLNAGKQIGSVNLGAIPTNWRIAAAGDFNGDGKPDILWEDTASGARLIWFLSGGVQTGSASLGVIPVNWRIAATGDFNGDGKQDILWEDKASGTRIIWFMNGSTQTGSANLGVIPSNWRIATTGDFNGDGQTDIIWEDTKFGSRVIWFMNGSVQIGSASLGIIPIEWQIRN